MKKYKIRYLPFFEEQLIAIIQYIVFKLNNAEIAENLYDLIKNEILKRSNMPEAYQPFKIINGKKYYRLNVKSYSIFYTVSGNTMQIRRIYYGKRDFKKLFY